MSVDKNKASGYDKYINWKTFGIPLRALILLLIMPTPKSMLDVGVEYSMGSKYVQDCFAKELFDKIKENNLAARLEGHENDLMRKGLKILGYLAIHTRQLDMIVSNSASINHQRAKIMKDLREVVTAQ